VVEKIGIVLNLEREVGMGTAAEWSRVALIVTAMGVGMVCLELLLELVGVKNNPRESLISLRYVILFALLFGMIDVFRERLLHGVLLLLTIGVALAFVASGIVNHRFSRLTKAP
jgi:hypothetical protein